MEDAIQFCYDLTACEIITFSKFSLSFVFLQNSAIYVACVLIGFAKAVVDVKHHAILGFIIHHTKPLHK